MGDGEDESEETSEGPGHKSSRSAIHVRSKRRDSATSKRLRAAPLAVRDSIDEIGEGSGLDVLFRVVGLEYGKGKSNASDDGAALVSEPDG